MITKILMAVLLVAVIGSGVAVFALIKMSAVNASTGAVYDGGLQLKAIAEMRNAFNRTRINVLDHLVAGDSVAKAKAEQAIADDAQPSPRRRTPTSSSRLVRSASTPWPIRSGSVWPRRSGSPG